MATGRAERALAAALLALAASAGAGAQDLGTLFHSPEERARLERLRRGEAPARLAVPRAGAELTGFVKRSDGRNTVWIDGVPLPVAGPNAAPLLDPRAVSTPGSRAQDVKVERGKAR